MGVAAVRRVVADLLPDYGDIHHLGLRWDRFYREQPDRTDKKGGEKRLRFLESFESMPASALAAYVKLYEVRRALLTRRDAATKEWAAAGRVCFGAGDEGVLEVGMRFHHTYGVPVVPGSAQKGLVRRIAARLIPEHADLLLGKPGETGYSAAVTFHDALWIPSSGGPFAIDTITVHHREYYKGKGSANDWDSPSPISLLSATGAFLFAVEGTKSARELALRLLATALRDDGIGARTLKGYGRFKVPEGDALPVNGDIRSLWGQKVAVENDGPAPSPPPPVTGVQDANVTYDPGSGVFKVQLPVGGRSMTAVTGRMPQHLFEGQDDTARSETMNTFIARCKKKGSVRARVTFEASGNHPTVKKIEPLA